MVTLREDNYELKLAKWRNLKKIDDLKQKL